MMRRGGGCSFMVSKFLYQIEYIVDIHWVVCRNHVPSTRYLQDIRLLLIRICGLYLEHNEYTTQNYNEFCTRDAGFSSVPLFYRFHYYQDLLQIYVFTFHKFKECAVFTAANIA